MNTKLFTALALAGALLVGQPAFGRGDNGGGGRGGGGGGGFSGGGGRAVSASRGGGGGGGRSFASGGTFRAQAGRGGYSSSRGFASSNAGFGSSTRGYSRPSVAFGGSTVQARSNSSRAGRSDGGQRYTYGFASRSGWSRNREYDWNGHHYRWYDNAWYIVDPYDYGYGYGYGDGYGYYGPAYSDYDDGGPVAQQVQAALAHDGYYRGPVDGIVGPGTRAAISAFQEDNGLRVTGNINHRLLSYLGVG